MSAFEDHRTKLAILIDKLLRRKPATSRDGSCVAVPVLVGTPPTRVFRISDEKMFCLLFDTTGNNAVGIDAIATYQGNIAINENTAININGVSVPTIVLKGSLENE